MACLKLRSGKKCVLKKVGVFTLITTIVLAFVAGAYIAVDQFFLNKDNKTSAPGSDPDDHVIEQDASQDTILNENGANNNHVENNAEAETSTPNHQNPSNENSSTINKDSYYEKPVESKPIISDPYGDTDTDSNNFGANKEESTEEEMSK